MIGNKILHIFVEPFIVLAFSGPALESEIFCLNTVIVACLYGVFNSGPTHTYQQGEQTTITFKMFKSMLQFFVIGNMPNIPPLCSIWSNK